MTADPVRPSGGPDDEFVRAAEPFRRELLVGLRRVTSFGDPALLPLFGFGLDASRAVGA
jgi:hypothetical protein